MKQRSKSWLFLIFLLGAIGSPIANASGLGSSAPALIPADHQAVVYLKSASDIGRFSQALPRNLKVLSAQGEFLILASNSRIDADALARLRGLPTVKSVRAVEKIFTRIEKNIGICNGTCSFPPSRTESLSNEIQEITTKASPACTNEVLCPNHGTEKLWAQSRVDADLMQNFIAERKLRSPSALTRVAVIDTGFDPLQLQNMHQGERIKILPGVIDPSGKPLVGDPRSDVAGHGTMVASVIGAKGGLGVAPHAALSVYRVTSDDQGETSTAFLESAIRRACDDAKKEDPKSTPVINVSWGNRLDEMGDERDEVKHPELMKYLTTQGCLVLKAAGNSSFVTDDSAVNGEKLDDPFLRVSATARVNGRADFSSSGEIDVPGDNVFVRVSSLQKPAPGIERACEKLKEGDPAPSSAFASGTSFSAPMAAGLASEVIGVLRSSSKFDALIPSARIALVTRILKASSYAGSVNGLRAVIIADEWNRAAASSVLPKVSELSSLVQKQTWKNCGVAPTACENSAAECGLQSQCREERRAQATLCAGDQATPALLLKQSLDSRALQSASKYFRALEEAAPGSSTNRYASEILNVHLNSVVRKGDWNPKEEAAAWEAAADLKYGFDNGLVRELFPAHFQNLRESGSESSKAEAKRLIQLYLNSSAFQAAMNSGPGRGSEATLESLMSSFSALKTLLGEEQFASLIEATLTGLVLKHRDWSLSTGWIDALVSVVRVSNALAADPRFQSLRKRFGALDQTLFKELDSYKDIKPEYKNASSVFLLEIEATGAYFDAFLERMRGPLREQLETGDLARLSSFKKAFAYRELDSILDDPAQRAEMRLRLAASNAGLGSSVDFSLGKTEFYRALRSMGDPAALKERVRKLLESSKDPFELLGAARLFASPQTTLTAELKTKKKFRLDEGYTLLKSEPGKVSRSGQPETTVYTYWLTEQTSPVILDGEILDRLRVRAFQEAGKRALVDGIRPLEFARVVEELKPDLETKAAFGSFFAQAISEAKASPSAQRKLNSIISAIQYYSGARALLKDNSEARSALESYAKTLASSSSESGSGFYPEADARMIREWIARSAQ